MLRKRDLEQGLSTIALSRRLGVGRGTIHGGLRPGQVERALSAAGARPSNDRLRGAGVRRRASEAPRASGRSAPGRVARLTGPDGLQGPLLRSDTDLPAAGAGPARVASGGTCGRAATRARSGLCAAAGLLLVVAGLLGVSAAAQAQTLTTFVSNTDETARPSVNNTAFWVAGSFLAASDIVVSEIEISLGRTGEAVLKIRENNTSNRPGDLVAELTSPGTLTADSLTTFTAPAGTTLDQNETYWITWGEGVQNANDIAGITTTASDNETGETGWEIGDSYLWKFSDAGTTWTISSTSLMFAVKGTLGGTTLSTDATLSALALDDFDGDAITLNETFASTLLTYTASVENRDTQIDVKPTLSDANATIEYLDGDGVELTDADPDLNGFQVDLDPGDNVIQVKVTAEDTTTTQTYMVTVTREATTGTCLAPTFTGRDEVWRGTITVGNDAFSYGYEDNGFGDLSDTDFEYGGTTYTIKGIRESADPSSMNRLEFSLDVFPPRATGPTCACISATTRST